MGRSTDAAEYQPCFQFACRQRSKPSGVCGPVDAPHAFDISHCAWREPDRVFPPVGKSALAEASVGRFPRSHDAATPRCCDRFTAAPVAARLPRYPVCPGGGATGKGSLPHRRYASAQLRGSISVPSRARSGVPYPKAPWAWLATANSMLRKLSIRAMTIGQ
jgi:hypothetical protein